MTVSGYRGRFAPSPTGELHLGLLRTALIGWLRARSEGGAFVIRIEDLDGPRVVPGSAAHMLDTLRWIGLDWDEGPDLQGPYAPYVQSQRLAHYAAALSTLQRGGYVYRCTCTRKEVSLQSAPHGIPELGPVYPGTCRQGPTRTGVTASLRFLMPETPARFVDGVHGKVSALVPAPGDFVLRRADQLFSYQLAVVVDDIEMQISEVLRGDDLLSSTPWQLALYDALGAPRPAFAHVPLLLGPDGTRLAKRHGATSVAQYRRQGVPAQQIVGFLAHSVGLVDEPVAMHPAELVSSFALSKLSTEATLLRADGLFPSFGEAP